MMLMAAVVVLPLMIMHDGTAQGFTQILLTYTLSVITFQHWVIVLITCCQAFTVTSAFERFEPENEVEDVVILCTSLQYKKLKNFHLN